MSVNDYLIMFEAMKEIKEKRELKKDVQTLTGLTTVLSSAVNLTPGGAVSVYNSRDSVSIIPGVSTGFIAVDGRDYDLTAEIVPGVALPVSYWDAAGRLYQSVSGAMPDEAVQAQIATSLYSRQDLNIGDLRIHIQAQGNLLNHIQAQVENNSSVIDDLEESLI